MTWRRVDWSWAATPKDVAARRLEAAGLVGLTIEHVRYFDIDYRSHDLRSGEVVPRTIESAAEWADPTWAHPACDTVDFAVEIETLGGRVFSVSWDSPGAREGVGLRELPATGNAFVADADVAMWDVSERSRWARLRGSSVTSVELDYRSWSGDAQWCPLIRLEVAGSRVLFALAEGAFGKDEVVPSADNIAVIFDQPPPAWMMDDSR